MLIKNSLYDYTVKECLNIEIPGDIGYAWYDYAMYSTCNKMIEVLRNNFQLRNTYVYKALDELNTLIMKHINNKNGYFNKNQLFEYLNSLCYVQLQQVELKNNPEFNDLFTNFDAYYNCGSRDFKRNFPCFRKCT